MKEIEKSETRERRGRTPPHEGDYLVLGPKTRLNFESSKSEFSLTIRVTDDNPKGQVPPHLHADGVVTVVVCYTLTLLYLLLFLLVYFNLLSYLICLDIRIRTYPFSVLLPVLVYTVRNLKVVYP